MPRHAAPVKRISPKPFIWSGVGVLALVLVILFVCNGGIQFVSAGLSGLFSASSEPESESESLSSEVESSETSDDVSMEESGGEETPPSHIPTGEIRAVWLRPGVDYATDEDADEDAIKKELSAVFGQLQSWSMNTVLLPLFEGEKALYTSSLADSYAGWDMVSYITALARGMDMQVYGVLELGQAGDLTAPNANEKLTALTAEVAACGLDGVYLTGYTVEGNGDYGAYLAAGSGDRTAFVRQSVTRAVTAAVAALRAADAKLYVGLLADPLWATAEAMENGCAVTGLTASYDKGADTRGWVTAGLFDCVMADIPVAVGDKKADFSVLLTWWATLCAEQELPLYVSHTVDGDWESPDQLAQQLLACKGQTAWKGSAFDSYAALKADEDGSTEALFKVYSGTLQSEYITDTLVITDPTKSSVTTKESHITFSGSADPNFPLTVDGEAIPLTKHGFFSWSADLEPGGNVFAFTHKGKTVKYTVTYTLTVLDSMYPSSSLTLEGDSTLTISAIARKGSKVYAYINGEKIRMEASPLESDEDDSKDLTDFENYSASYTLPAGKIGITQVLGRVEISATYGDLKTSLTGGSVSVAALPEPKPEPEPEPESSDTSTGSSGEFNPGGSNTAPKIPDKLTTIDPSVGGDTLGTGQIIVVTGEYAQTYRSDSPNMSRPEYAYLPRGTTDLVVGKVNNSSGTYYKLQSGRLIQATREVDKYEDDKVQIYDVTVVDTYKSSGKITENTLTGAELNIGYDYTVLYLGTTWRVPYDLQLLPQNYYKESNTEKAVDPDYTLRSQAAEYVDVTFHYTTQVPVLPDITGSPLFSSAKWIREDDAYVLRLYMRDKGAFYGYSAAWDEQGNLVLAFRHPQNVTKSESKPLSGFKIVIDAGHGGGYGRPEFSPGVQEHIQCLQISSQLRDKLVALGATVVMTREDNSISPDLYDRTTYARNTNADMFISIHTNAANQKARGISVHYFSPYSFDLADTVAEYGAKTYKTFTGSEKYDYGVFNRGAKWDPFTVTRIQDCPAILIECGFLDNAQDRELLIDPKFQSALCDNFVEGILAYYKAAPQHSITLTPTTTTTTTTSSGISTAPTTTDPSATTDTGTATTLTTTEATVSTAMVSETEDPTAAPGNG